MFIWVNFCCYGNGCSDWSKVCYLFSMNLRLSMAVSAFPMNASNIRFRSLLRINISYKHASDLHPSVHKLSMTLTLLDMALVLSKEVDEVMILKDRKAVTTLHYSKVAGNQTKKTKTPNSNLSASYSALGRLTLPL